MNLRLNGEWRELPDGATVMHAVAVSGVPGMARGVAVALDGEVVTRGQWQSTEIRDGQAVEILQAVQGG